MGRYFMAFCDCGGLAAIAAADTTDDIALNSKQAKRWEKRGLKVELRVSPRGTPLPAWCEKTQTGACRAKAA